MTTVVNLAMPRGDTKVFDLAFTEDDEVTPLDLTAVSDIRFTARRYFGSVTATIEKSIGAGIEVDADPSTGLAVLTILPADTEDLDPRIRRFRYDCQLIDGAGQVSTPIKGVLRVDPDVTHSGGS